MIVAIDDRPLAWWRPIDACRDLNVHTAQNGAPDQRPDGRQQQQQPNGIGEKAGGEQQKSSGHETYAVERLFHGHFTPRKRFLGAEQGTHSLVANQDAPGQCGQDHQTERRPNADFAADHDKERDLGRWYANE